MADAVHIASAEASTFGETLDDSADAGAFLVPALAPFSMAAGDGSSAHDHDHDNDVPPLHVVGTEAEDDEEGAAAAVDPNAEAPPAQTLDDTAANVGDALVEEEEEEEVGSSSGGAPSASTSDADDEEGGGAVRSAHTASTGTDYANAFALSRVRELLKYDGCSSVVARDAAVTAGEAVALLLRDLTQAAAAEAQRRNRKTVTYDDVARVAQLFDRFSFLSEVLPPSRGATAASAAANAAAHPSGGRKTKTKQPAQRTLTSMTSTTTTTTTAAAAASAPRPAPAAVPRMAHPMPGRNVAPNPRF